MQKGLIEKEKIEGVINYKFSQKFFWLLDLAPKPFLKLKEPLAKQEITQANATEPLGEKDIAKIFVDTFIDNPTFKGKAKELKQKWNL